MPWFLAFSREICGIQSMLHKFGHHVGVSTAEQPTDSNMRDQESGNGAGLNVASADKPRHEAKAGGQAAVCTYPRNLLADRVRRNRILGAGVTF